VEPDTLLTINRPTVIFDVQDGETVVIDLASGHYYRLDAASTALWQRFDGSTTVAAVLESCDNRPELEPRVTAIVGDLVEKALLAPARVDATATEAGPWHFGGFTLELFTDLEDILGLDPIHEVDPARGWPHVAEA
jgi:hypothetical protein